MSFPTAVLADTYTDSGTGTINLSDGFIAGGTPIPAVGTTLADTLIFSPAAISTQTDDLLQPLNANVLTFNAAAALTLNKGTGTQIAIGGTAPVVNLSGAAAVTDALNHPLLANTTFQGTGAGVVTLSGIVSGVGALTKTGSSSLTLTGNNTYSGGTTLSGGTLSFNADSAFGVIPAAPATNLTVTAASTLTPANSVGLSSKRSISITGATTVSFNLGANTLAINGSITTNNAGAILQTVNGNTGTLILAGSNNFAAGTTVKISGGTNTNGGIIRLANSNALGTNALTINNTGGNNSSISVVELAGNITIPSTVTMNMAGHNNPAPPGSDLLRNVSGNNVFNGAFTIAAGGGGYPVNSADVNGTLTLGGPIKNNVASSTRAPAFYGVGNGVVSGLMSDGSATAITAASYAGTGTWTIPQTANSYTGSTTISAGVVEVAALGAGGTNSSIGASTSAAGNLVLAGGNLRYTGTSAASTDRLFTISTGTTNTLDTSATAGALTFSNTGAVAFAGTAASQTLVLTGSNAGVNRFAPSIGNGNAGAAVTSLTKSGTDTWSLTGASTYTGATTINGGGTLQLDFSDVNAPAANILNNTTNSSALTMAGGTLALIGKANTTNSQQFNGLTINQGGSQIVLSASATSNPLAINVGTITRNTGGTMDFALPAGAQGSANGVLTTASPNAAGILGGWATVNNGADWATTDGTNVQPYAGYTALTAAGGGTAGATNFNAAGTLALTAPVTANSLRIASNADSQSLDLAGNNVTLTGTTGGLLYAGGGTANAHSIVATGGGTLSAGSGEFLVNTATGSTLTISAVVTGTAASGSAALTKAGAGTLVLSSQNTYTGDTVVSAGTLVASNANAIPNGTGKGNVIAASGGTFAVSGTTNINGLTGSGFVQSAGGAATLTFGNGDVGTTFAGTLRDGAGTLGLSKVGNGTMVLSGNNSFTGPVTVTTGSSGGALQVTSSTALGNSSGVTLSNSTLAGGGGSTLQLSGNITISGIPLNAVTSNTGGSRRTTLSAVSGSPTWAGNIVLSGNDLAQFTTATGTVLTLAGPVTGPSFSGTFFVRGAAGTGNITGLVTLPSTAALAKTDAGTWIISRSGNTWGNTSVSVGTLQMGAAGALPSTTALTMGQNDTNVATLDLNGFDQTVASLTLSSGATGNKTITSTGTIRATLTVNAASASTWGNATSVTNLLAGNLGLTKTGAATFTLSGTGANTYTGATTITAGTLALGTANRIPASSQVVLGGGTLATNGLNDTAGALTLTSSSTIDMGNGASILQFANSSGEPWTGTLTINNWSGNPDLGGGTDQIFVGNSAFTLTSTQLSQIVFGGYGAGAKLLTNGELVPVPEPTTAALAAMGIGGLLLRRRRGWRQDA